MRRRILSIRWIVSATVAALVTLIMFVAGALSERSTRAALSQQIESRLRLQSQNLALASARVLLGEFPELTIQPLVNDVVARQPDLAIAAVVDRAGRVQGHLDARALGAPLALPPGLVALPGRGDAGGTVLYENAELLVAATQVVGPEGELIGRAWIGQRRDGIDRMLERSRRQQLIALAAFLAFGVASSFALITLLLRPVSALRAGIERIGQGDLATPVDVRDRTELGALAETLNRMGSELSVAQTRMVERERLAHEMGLARRIQRSLLPPCRIVEGRYLIDGAQDAAAEVGGDTYDILDLPDGRIGVLIADVSGKGLAGSVITAMLDALVHALAPQHRSPAALLAALDGQLGRLIDRQSFVTMFYAVLDPATHELTFASAGHNPLLVLRASGSRAEWLRVRGPALGAMRSLKLPPRFEEGRVTLEPGDVVVQYTDGVSECENGEGAQFGNDRIAEAALEGLAGGTPRVVQALTRATARWRGQAPRGDDETLLVVGRLASDAAREDSAAAAAERAIAQVHEAERRGERLVLPGSLAALVRLDDWLAQVSPCARLGGRTSQLVRLVLNEVCANVIEHGFDSNPAARLTLWWVPGAGEPLTDDPVEELAAGWFLVRDSGAAYEPPTHDPPQLDDPKVRRRGRGFGREIVHRAAAIVDHSFADAVGNVTRITFDPGKLREREMSS